MSKFIRCLRAVVAVLEDKEDETVAQSLEQLKDNHLFHLQAEVVTIQNTLVNLSNKIGRLEGRVGLILAVSAMILSAMIGVLVQGFQLL